MYRGRRVRAAYEKGPDGLLARRMEVVIGGARAEHPQTMGRSPPPDGPPPDAAGRPLEEGLRPERGTSGPVGDSPGERARKVEPSMAPSAGTAGDMEPGVVRRRHKSQTNFQIDPQIPAGSPSTVVPDAPRAASPSTVEQQAPRAGPSVDPQAPRAAPSVHPQAPRAAPSTRRPAETGPLLDNRRPSPPANIRGDEAASQTP
jgi:hypothetical protein